MSPGARVPAPAVALLRLEGTFSLNVPPKLEQASREMAGCQGETRLLSVM